MTDPPDHTELIARIHGLWLKIHAALAGGAVLTDQDFLILGRVAGVLNPSLGGLSACYLSDIDIDAADRDRVDVLVANVATITFNLLRADEVVRPLVTRYFLGNGVAGVTDRARAEVSRYGDALDDAVAHPSFEHVDHVSRRKYEDSLRRVFVDVGANATSDTVSQWVAVTRDAVARLPTTFTGNHVASNNKVVIAAMDAVQAVQPTPVWGCDPSRATGLQFAIAASGFGSSVEKLHALAEIWSYYVSIEKARDAVKGDWEGLRPMDDPGATTWNVLNVGWSEEAKETLRRFDGEVRRVRSSTICREIEPSRPAH